MTETPQLSAAELHKCWARLEDEQHQLALAIHQASITGEDSAPTRQRQAKLLLEINTVVNAMQIAPATSIEDFMALLDVALEHEHDLPADIAAYGPAEYPMTARLLQALVHKVPEFDFNSLRRWLSPSQFKELMGRPNSFG